jgi:hypothetical protein
MAKDCSGWSAWTNPHGESRAWDSRHGWIGGGKATRSITYAELPRQAEKPLVPHPAVLRRWGFTRLTNAFSKKVENHEAALACYFMPTTLAALALRDGMR